MATHSSPGVCGALILGCAMLTSVSCSSPPATVRPVSRSQEASAPGMLGQGDAVRLSDGVSLIVPRGWQGRVLPPGAAPPRGAGAVTAVVLSEAPSSSALAAVRVCSPSELQNILAADRAVPGALIRVWSSSEGTLTVTETTYTVGASPQIVHELGLLAAFSDRSPVVLKVSDSSGRAPGWTGDLRADYAATASKFSLDGMFHELPKE
jgi:hypothetical protein